MPDLNVSRAVDPVLMMADAGYVADPWQERLLRSKSDRLMLLCGRQMGKSLTTACKAVHRSQYFDDSLVLLISRSQDQSDELFRKIISVYNAIDRPVKAIREMVSEIEFENGSRIVALPNNPDTVRGYSGASLLIIDEASRVPVQTMVSVRPMIMASSGDILLLSTPCGQSGFFYDQWVDPYGRWERIMAKAAECPRFDPAELEEVRRELGSLMASQELDCCFLQSDSQVFTSSSIDAAFDSDVPAFMGF